MVIGEHVAYQQEFIDVNFSVLVYVYFTENFMKLVLCYVFSSFLSNTIIISVSWFCMTASLTGISVSHTRDCTWYADHQLSLHFDKMSCGNYHNVAYNLMNLT